MTRPDTAPRTQAEADALHANAMATIGTAFRLLDLVEPDLKRLVDGNDRIMDHGCVLAPGVYLALTGPRGTNARHQVTLARAALAFVATVREVLPQLPKEAA